MSKTITLVSVMLAASLVAVRNFDSSCYESPVSTEATYFNQKTTELAKNYNVFKTTLEAAIHSLEAGQVNLADATTCVYAAAEAHCPIYLDRVPISDPAGTLEGSVARNLVGHLRSKEEIRPVLGQRIEELEIERQNLTNQLKGSNLR